MMQSKLIKDLNRREKLELLIEIEEAIDYFEERIDQAEWSLNFGSASVLKSMWEKAINEAHTYKMCIDRLNQRFENLKKLL